MGHEGCVHGSRENDSGKLFALYFLQKDKIPVTHSNNSKYDADQDERTGTPKYSDVREGEVPKLLAGKRGTNLERDGGRSILQLRPPTDDWGRKA